MKFKLLAPKLVSLKNSGAGHLQRAVLQVPHDQLETTGLVHGGSGLHPHLLATPLTLACKALLAMLRTPSPSSSEEGELARRCPGNCRARRGGWPHLVCNLTKGSAGGWPLVVGWPDLPGHPQVLRR